MASTVTEARSPLHCEPTPLLGNGNDPNLESQPHLENDHTDTPRLPAIGMRLTTSHKSSLLQNFCIVLLAAWVGVAADTTVIATPLAPISTPFSSFNSITWIATGHFTLNATLKPFFGKLTDIY
ncbi:unnamed protein product [Tuber aestivum]|uniref:Major facilitator superfamily (MFS) profile domain-containing protein n=1 Tax=Tuber aestivum TaxID=59557 RepID=A0A292PYA8_9PEZI|nr:unnamed protein product [Tuber aestivum]